MYWNCTLFYSVPFFFSILAIPFYALVFHFLFNFLGRYHRKWRGTIMHQQFQEVFSICFISLPRKIKRFYKVKGPIDCWTIQVAHGLGSLLSPSFCSNFALNSDAEISLRFSCALQKCILYFSKPGSLQKGTKRRKMTMQIKLNIGSIKIPYPVK